MGGRSNLAELGLLRQDILRMGGLVVAQLKGAIEAFADSDLEAAESVIERDDLVDNINLRVEARSFRLASARGADHRAAISALKVATNLEHCGDAATHIAKHIRLMRSEGLAEESYELGPLAQLVPRALKGAIRAYLAEDMAQAKRACQREPEVDEMYKEGLAGLSDTIQMYPENVRYYLHVLAVLKYLEKVGDYVLNIGEQTIYLISGRRLKFAQFQQLDSLLGESASESGFSPFLDGVSGAVVARVGNGIPLVYKEGSRRKIAEEIKKSDQWRRIDKNLTPKVLSIVSHKDRQALLREFVSGILLSDIYFEEQEPGLEIPVTERLIRTVMYLWESTIVSDQPQISYVEQIRDRLPEVFSLHPALRRLASSPVRYRGTVCPPLKQQLEKAAVLQPSLAPPFSVWLHGDFNPNNVVYNQEDDALKFIDIHRSRFGDYLQDITVFVVGLRRDPDASPSTRKRLKRVEDLILAEVGRFAEEKGDGQFQRRLHLGLARSYLTSARIILQPAHAEWLFRQGRIYLQKVLDSG